MRQASRAKNLLEKGADPLQRGEIQNEIEAIPKGQTPFRIAIKFSTTKYRDMNYQMTVNS